MSSGLNAANTYFFGELVRLTWTHQNSSGTYIDPTAVLLWVRHPDGSQVTFTHGVGTTIIQDSTGHYHADVSADEIGTYSYRAFATGTGQSAIEAECNVRSRFF